MKNKSQSTMLFISHSSSDAQTVKALVSLIEKSFFGLNKLNIRCTSVEGYKLSLGDYPRRQLPAEIGASLVICLLTPRSLASAWVMFELGAAWGLSSKVIPLLHGPSHNDLPAALDGSTAAYLNNSSDLEAIIDRISDELGWRRHQTARIGEAIRDFESQLSAVETVQPQRLMLRKDLYSLLPWEEVFRKSTKELYIWGWSGKSAVNNRTRNLIKSHLGKGRKVNILILNEEMARQASQFLSMGPVCSWSEKAVKDDIAEGRRVVTELREALSREENRNLDCRETSWNMTWSGVAMDPDEQNGLLQIENYLYNYADCTEGAEHLDFRPNLLLTPDATLYRPYRFSLQQMWAAAHEIV